MNFFKKSDQKHQQTEEVADQTKSEKIQMTNQNPESEKDEVQD